MREVGGRWTSLGRRLLVAWLGTDAEHTARELARKCHVTPAAISALATGVAAEPRVTLAFAIEDHAGIRARAWTLERRLEMAKSNSFDRRHGTTEPTSKPPRQAAE